MEVDVSEISEGDIVRDHGLVATIHAAPYGGQFRFRFQNGDLKVFVENTKLVAFTEVKNA